MGSFYSVLQYEPWAAYSGSTQAKNNNHCEMVSLNHILLRLALFIKLSLG
jgi:hypothetical protein